LMKNQSKCDGGIDQDDPEVKNLLLQNKGDLVRNQPPQQNKG